MLPSPVRRAAFAFSVGMLGAAAATAEVRTWTADNGKFTLQAELVEVRGDSVVLKKADGSTGTVSIGHLSDADRKYLAALKPPPAQLNPPIQGNPSATLTFRNAVTKPPSWNDANTPFDMAKFLQAPPPEENAAPLYLEALCEVDPWLTQELLPETPEEDLRRLANIHRERRRVEWRLEMAWEKDPKTVDGAQVDAWLADYDGAFQKLRAAQQRPKCLFQTDRNVNTLILHVTAGRTVDRLVQWRARRALDCGDIERPLDDLKMQLRLSRDLQRRGGLSALLFCTQMDWQACELVRKMLNAPGVDVRSCDRMLALLGEHEVREVEPLVDAYRGEFVHSRQGLHDLQHRTGVFDPKTMKDEWGRFEGDASSPLECVKLLGDHMGDKRLAEITSRLQPQPGNPFAGPLLPDAWSGGKMLSDEDYAKEVDALNRAFASIIALFSETEFRSIRDLDAAADLCREPLRETLLASLVGPGNLTQFVRMGETRRRAAQCLVALKRWQIEHAEAPPDLETVFKAAGLPGVPIDPFSNEPLRLGTVAGQPVIYSVGRDGKDDKAQKAWDRSRTGQGDLIYSLAEVIP